MKDEQARTRIDFYKGELERLRTYNYELANKHHNLEHRLNLLEKHLGVEYQPVSKEHPKYVKVESK